MSKESVKRLRVILAWICWLGAALCWAVAFLAGHDVWQAMGRPDFWRGQGLAAFDMRVFAWAFYLMPWLGLGALVAGWFCRGWQGGEGFDRERGLER